MAAFYWYQPGSYQVTLQKDVFLSGPAAFHDGEGRIIIRPAPPGTGIVFRCGSTIVPARIAYLDDEPGIRTTIITASNNEAPSLRIYTVEHLLSALYGLSISNAIVEIGTNGLLPFFDGSADAFCRAIASAGGCLVQSKHLKRVACCQSRICVQGIDGSYIEVNPPTTESLKIEARIEFQRKPLETQEFIYSHSSQAYCLEIARARTFATCDFVHEDVSRQSLPGFYKNEYYDKSYVESSMIVFSNGRYVTTPRFLDEAVRHKILDLIGDMTLLGFEVIADVKAFKMGHRLNWKLVKTIAGELEKAGSPSSDRVVPREPGDSSRFVSDVTLPDNSTVETRATVTKVWRVRNAGLVQWRGRFLQREGPSLGESVINSESRVPIPDTAPGEEIDLVVVLTMPSLPGWYRAEWKMVDANGAYYLSNQDPLVVMLRVV